jgi:2-oxoglutarate ferredoxin oxidoreductase subunit gamma
MGTRSVRFCGFGGQGVVLASVILGEAIVKGQGLYAAQTQSYGSEARGGACQAELLVSETPVLTPARPMSDILVALFQTAYDTGGLVIVERDLVPDARDVGASLRRVPATETAVALGNRMAANMVMLGYLQAAADIVMRDHLVRAIAANVPQRFVDLNVAALDAGISLATGAA